MLNVFKRHLQFVFLFFLLKECLLVYTFPQHPTQSMQFSIVAKWLFGRQQSLLTIEYILREAHPSQTHMRPELFFLTLYFSRKLQKPAKNRRYYGGSVFHPCSKSQTKNAHPPNQKLYTFLKIHQISEIHYYCYSQKITSNSEKRYVVSDKCKKTQQSVQQYLKSVPCWSRSCISPLNAAIIDIVQSSDSELVLSTAKLLSRLYLYQLKEMIELLFDWNLRLFFYTDQVPRIGPEIDRRLKFFNSCHIKENCYI